MLFRSRISALINNSEFGIRNSEFGIAGELLRGNSSFPAEEDSSKLKIKTQRLTSVSFLFNIKQMFIFKQKHLLLFKECANM